MAASRNVLLNRLQEGTTFRTFNCDGSWNEYFFYLSPKIYVLCYNVSKKVLQNSATDYLLKDCEVRSGFKTDTWIKALRSGTVKEQQEGIAFSILHSRGRKSFDMLASDTETRDAWVEGLQMIISETSGTRYRKITDIWLRELFNKADRDHNGLLSKREVYPLLSQLNVRLKTDEFDRYFEQTELQWAKLRGQLRVDEFITFYKLLTYRPELLHIIHIYSESCDLCACNVNSTIERICPGLMRDRRPSSSPMLFPAFPISPVTMNSTTNNYMTVEELREFMLIEQKQVLSLTEVEELIKKFDQSTEAKECTEMGVDGLREMLLSEEYLLMKPEHRTTVYQDMTRPLTDYWINTSHNTYLCATQIAGASSGESYVQALKRGCRSVELDLHDGADGRPVVRHAFTFVKDAYLGEILIQIKEFAFCFSPYPLFLNLENHCSNKQQVLIAKLLTDTFGASIYTANEAIACTTWPSPEQLTRRIILRGRATPKNDVSLDYSPEDEPCDQEASDICKELPTLIACQNTTFKDFARAKLYKHTQSSSLSEKKASTMVEQHSLELTLHNQRSITRIYPSGYRQNSSNLDPVAFWNAGIQMVALNFQTGDLSMSLNHARFLDNKQCGYILKPAILRDNNTTFSPYSCYSAYLLARRRPLKFEIRVVSAQHLPKSNQNDTAAVSPFVKVKIFGVRCDQNGQRTSAVANNGLNPIWNHLMQFSICIPELCLIRFTVKDNDKSNTDLGQYAIPFLSMQSGYRHMRLLNEHNASTSATLLVNIKVNTME